MRSLARLPHYAASDGGKSVRVVVAFAANLNFDSPGLIAESAALAG
jgi:hypothetical protein